MIYVFDASSLLRLDAFFPSVFPAFWTKLDHAVRNGIVISTREVRTEIKRGDESAVANWAKTNARIFTMPTADEGAFVAQIFQVEHFQQLIGRKQQQRGTPVADPFVIACAKVNKGTVVTEERLKPNAAKIPNVCAHFNVPCTNLEGFMRAQGWRF